MSRCLPTLVVALACVGTLGRCAEDRDAGGGTPAAQGRVPGVVFIPTPADVVDRMLQLAAVKPSDVVYDLGCGDGRILVAAAQQYGCRAVGVDIDALRVQASRDNVRRGHVEHLVTIRQQDLFHVDLRPADVVFLYLTPRYNVRLLPQLRTLKPGSRIVSHQFELGGIRPDKVAQVPCEQDGHRHTLYLWTTPLSERSRKVLRPP